MLLNQSVRGDILKFIWYLIALAASAAVFIAYYTATPHPLNKDFVISINQKHVTREEFNARLASIHNADRQDFINSLIVRELMIQAAEKEGIDKNEAFRRSIQDYYEQSLIKQVMDKKIKDIKVSVTDQEIDRFIAFQNSTVTVTTFLADDENAAEKAQFKSHEVRTVRVNDLADDACGRLECLKEGECTPPFKTDRGCEVVRLDKVVCPADQVLSAKNRDKIRSLLLARKRQKAIDSWIADMKAGSKIEVLIK